jgi:hypothetical protein
LLAKWQQKAEFVHLVQDKWFMAKESWTYISTGKQITYMWHIIFRTYVQFFFFCHKSVNKIGFLLPFCKYLGSKKLSFVYII